MAAARRRPLPRADLARRPPARGASRPACPRPPRCAPCPAAGRASRGRTDRDRARRDARRESARRPARCPPTAVQSIEAALVESARSRGALVLAKHARVDDHEREKPEGRRRHPRGRNRVAVERQPRQHGAAHRDGQPEVRNEQVPALAARDRVAPARDAAPVFGSRVGHVHSSRRQTNPPVGGPDRQTRSIVTRERAARGRWPRSCRPPRSARRSR